MKSSSKIDNVLHFVITTGNKAGTVIHVRKVAKEGIEQDWNKESLLSSTKRWVYAGSI